jgi:hypothetical protein
MRKRSRVKDKRIVLIQESYRDKRKNAFVVSKSSDLKDLWREIFVWNGRWRQCLASTHLLTVFKLITSCLSLSSVSRELLVTLFMMMMISSCDHEMEAQSYPRKSGKQMRQESREETKYKVKNRKKTWEKKKMLLKKYLSRPMHEIENNMRSTLLYCFLTTENFCRFALSSSPLIWCKKKKLSTLGDE